MDIVFKSAMILLLTAVIASSVKKAVPSMAIVLQIAGVALVLLLGVRLLQPILDFTTETASVLGSSGIYVKPIMKAAVIGATTAVGGSICKDAGHASAETALEIIGTAAVLYTALPVMQLFVHTIGELL